MGKSINQIALVTGIFDLLDKQHPGLKATPRQYNAIIDAANKIVDAFDKDDTHAGDNIGLDAWLKSDDVGASSLFMSQYLTNNGGTHTYYHPCDPSDFARCRILLLSVPELVPLLPQMADASRVWAELVDHWDELSQLLDEEVPNWRSGSGKAPKTYELMKSLGC